MSQETASVILYGMLGMRKLSVPWMPRLFTPDSKRKRETTPEQCLTLFMRNPKEFLGRFVTANETWVYWYTKETKKQLKQ